MKQQIHPSINPVNNESYFDECFIPPFEKNFALQQEIEKIKNTMYVKNRILSFLKNDLERIKTLGFYVKNKKSFDIINNSVSEEEVPFDFIERDSVIINNKPSPAIYIEHPHPIEISVSNKLSESGSVIIEVNPFMNFHPDRDLLKQKYYSSYELATDLYHFIAKNLIYNKKTQ